MLNNIHILFLLLYLISKKTKNTQLNKAYKIQFFHSSPLCDAKKVSFIFNRIFNFSFKLTQQRLIKYINKQKFNKRLFYMKKYF